MTIDADEEIFELSDPPGDALERAREIWLPRLEAGLPFAEILEIGSTAVAGLIGRRNLDFLARVRREDFFRAGQSLDGLLERDPRNSGDDALQAYRLPCDDLDIVLRLTVVGGPHDRFHLFVERLRDDARLRAAYNRLKQKCNGKTMRDYCTAKSDFVAKALGSRATGARAVVEPRRRAIPEKGKNRETGR
jgi:GrpB-like predicted nucleotidyltransferase (UPF0157 family)